jgi:catecholate siderophore receptor
MVGKNPTSRQNTHGFVRSIAKPAIGAAAVAGLAGLAPAALAQTSTTVAASAAANAAPTELSGVEVTGSQAKRAASPKFTSELRDTPQTVTVVPAAVIEAQNLMTLRDVLSTVPGITFGAGEGGGGYGDSINLRGYTANSDITVDGVRDSAQYTRSDPFNLDQIEVVNGASSVYSGAGSVGGNINLVSKTPGLRDSTVLSGGIGTDGYGRLTIDSNKPVSDTIAVRLNAMIHQADVPGRDVERFERWGFAPSIAFGLGTNTRAVLSYFHQSDDNTPQYGVPFYNGRPVPGIDPSNYYGYSNVDKQEIDVDTLTGVFSHDFSDALGVRNLTRWQKVTQTSIVNPPQQGSFCLANGFQPAGWSQTSAGTNLSGYVPCTTPGFYTVGGPRGNLRDTENTLAYNQTDLTWKGATGPLNHTLVVGVSFLHEEFELDTGNVQRTATGGTPTYPLMSITSPNHTYSGPLNYIRSSMGYGERNNQAVYVFDTIELTPQWQINGGVRWEHNEGSNRTDTFTTTAPVGLMTRGVTFTNDENLVSFRAGVVYKPQPNLSFYVAYGNSKTPSQSAVNGSCTAATCNVDPEEAENIEAGVKWDTNGGRLSLTAAVFRNERTNYKVASGDPTIPDQVLDGSSRVDGVALGLAGQLTDKWAVFANYTYLDSEVLQGASDFTARGGVTGTERDWIKGDPLLNVPDHAFSLWTTYDVTERLQVGYGVTYQGEMYLSQHAGVASAPATTPVSYVGRTTLPLVKSEAYAVHRLMVTYTVTEQLDLRLNVNNVTDEEYYTRIRNNGWATPGEARFTSLTANYRF